MIKWFGEPWDAPVCEPAAKVDHPRYKNCEECHDPFKRGDQGVLIEYLYEDNDPPSVGSRTAAWHLNCFLWTIAKVV